MQDFSPPATLYAAAAYRIFTAFQYITQALSAPRFNLKSLNVISRDLVLAEEYAGAVRIREARTLPVTYEESIRLKDV
jgi:hypothetical protein